MHPDLQNALLLLMAIGWAPRLTQLPQEIEDSEIRRGWTDEP